MPVIWMRKPEPDHEQRRPRVRGAQHLAQRAAALAAQVVLDLGELALGVGVRVGERQRARASSRRPFITYQRGVSGSRASRNSTSSDGTADSPSISRHASAPASA